MKILQTLLTSVAIATSLNAADAGEPYIAPYFNDKQAAMSFTFDDGFKGQVDNTLEIIDPLGIRGTFFVIPSRMDQNKGSINWAQAKAMQATGHEIGTHDAVKPRLHELTQDEVRQKVNGGADLIEQNTGVRSVSFAMPGGSKDTDEVMAVINEQHYFFRNPSYLPNVKRVAYGSEGKRKWEDEKTRKEIEGVIANGQWYIPVVHAIVKGYSPFKSKEEFKTHCEWVVSQEDVLWVAPMGEVGRYVFERDAAQLEIVEKSSDKLAFKLTHTLPDKVVFDHPLTVVIPVASVTSAEAMDANRNPVEASVKDGKVLINAKPNGEVIWVRWQ